MYRNIKTLFNFDPSALRRSSFSILVVLTLTDPGPGVPRHGLPLQSSRFMLACYLQHIARNKEEASQMGKAIADRVTKMHSRYGRRGMLALVIAMGALAVVPIPGITLLPLCIAELARMQRQNA
jgi:hypothetical protein